MSARGIYSWVAMVLTFTLMLLFLSYLTGKKQIEHFAPDPNIEMTMNAREKAPACLDAANAYKTVVRYIIDDFTGDGGILLSNFRDTFFQIDEECRRTGKCNPIGIKKDLDLDALQNDWSNPLKCQV